MLSVAYIVANYPDIDGTVTIIMFVSVNDYRITVPTIIVPMLEWTGIPSGYTSWN